MYNKRTHVDFEYVNFPLILLLLSNLPVNHERMCTHIVRSVVQYNITDKNNNISSDDYVEYLLENIELSCTKMKFEFFIAGSFSPCAGVYR